ncbi:DUF5677 domain-containing protein [Paenibacillus sp. FSL H7-0331]|uniref:DUF5677 domain-containing protein n=1 Tax=Paenibacillus sp. FSL H7-0331 TaxID=1920421 RepID=UPI00096C76A4|nr:DUF5677 domain-containing protein [Paenibacillus sp. FSL H7-0331]OMF02622.1 hypothetical protein BK127_37070 [Paenibacillus sp. FSL H7-0331]
MYIKEVMEEMEINHAKSLEANKIMVRLFDKYLLGGEIPDNLLSHLSLYFITKFHKSVLAFRMLVVSGFDEDASVVLRTLVELVIILAYISKKPEERVDRFIEFDFIAQYKLLQIVDKHYPNTVISNERRNQIEDDYRTYKHNYNRKDQWSDKTVYDMAVEVGMLFWYEMVYKIDSSYVHSNISASRGFMLEGIEGLQLAVGPQVFKATDILSKSCELSRVILFVALQNMGFDTDETIETWDNAQKLLQEEFRTHLEEEE